MTEHCETCSTVRRVEGRGELRGLSSLDATAYLGYEDTLDAISCEFSDDANSISLLRSLLE